MKTPTLRRAVILAGLCTMLTFLTSCMPFLLIFPVPAPMILNHPYLARIVDQGDGSPVEGADVRVQIYTKFGKVETLVRDYVARSDAQGTIYIPRESRPTLLILWTVGIVFFGPRNANGVADGGVAGLPDETQIVLTVTREGFGTRRMNFVENPRRNLKKPGVALPDQIRISRLDPGGN